MSNFGFCPLCDRKYTRKNPHTNHHIYFPRKKFEVDPDFIPITVDVCHICHQVEFHPSFRISFNESWTKEICLKIWIAFCEKKHKNVVKIYPQLISEIYG